jgi:hypothetical protein
MMCAICEVHPQLFHISNNFADAPGEVTTCSIRLYLQSRQRGGNYTREAAIGLFSCVCLLTHVSCMNQDLVSIVVVP